jgi:hypothetical protein
VYVGAGSIGSFIAVAESMDLDVGSTGADNLSIDLDFWQLKNGL